MCSIPEDGQTDEAIWICARQGSAHPEHCGSVSQTLLSASPCTSPTSGREYVYRAP
jgi:hypothetical protein